jgi:hypothetical protein
MTAMAGKDRSDLAAQLDSLYANPITATRIGRSNEEKMDPGRALAPAGKGRKEKFCTRLGVSAFG